MHQDASRKARLATELRAAGGLMQAGRLDEARARLMAIHAEAPFDPYILFNLGSIAWQRGEPDLAVRLYRQSLAVRPDFFEAVVNLGNALLELGQHREALRYCAMASRMRPADSGVWRNLARVLAAVDETKAALEAIERGIQANGRDDKAHRLRLSLLRTLRRSDEMMRRADELLAFKPDDAVALSTLVIQRQRLAAWEGLDHLVDRLAARAAQGVLGQSLLSMAFVLDDPQLMVQCARPLDAQLPGVRLARPPRRAEAGVLTVGYLSPDYRSHPVAHMLAEVLAAHDPTVVRALAIPIRRPDDSPVSVRLRSLVQEVVDVSALDDRAAAEAISRAGVDVLVDLAGATEGCRHGILRWRPAPVQLMWLGCPVTTGNSDCCDGFLVDAVVAPAGVEGDFSEPLLRLPTCYHPIATGQGGPLPALTRAEIGLPETGLVLAALHQPTKITRAAFRAWCRIAAAAPEAVLLLGAHQQCVRESMQQEAGREGLDPSRLRFAAWEDDRARYLARWPLVDLVLDGYPYGGHSTVGEALALGVPVLACAGRSLHTRVGASMLTTMGLPDLVASGLDAFESLGKQLVGDRSKLAQIRERCRRAALDHRPQTLVRALEAAYRSAWEQAPVTSST